MLVHILVKAVNRETMINRRQALKNIGLTAGYLALTPTVVSLLQSCTQEKELGWVPEFFSKDEAALIDELVDRIIPETDIPGAKSLNIPQFIDRYIDQVLEEEQALMIKKAAGRLINQLGINEKKAVSSLLEEDYESVLSTNLRADKIAVRTYHEMLERVETPADFDAISDEASSFGFLSAIRQLTIFGFRNTEEIGENVMAYLPVPGEQIGCAPLSEITNGKAWSL